MSGAKTKLLLATITVFLSTTIFGVLLPFAQKRVLAAPLASPPATFSYTDANNITSTYKKIDPLVTFTQADFNLTYTLVDPVSSKQVYDQLSVGTNKRLYATPSNASGCFSYIVLDGTVDNLKPESGQAYYRHFASSGCENGVIAANIKGTPLSQLVNPLPISISGYKTEYAAAIITPGEGATGGTNPGGVDPAGTCEGAIPVLGWIICIVTELADNVVSASTSMIESLMTIGPEEYGEGKDGVNGLKTAWSAIRYISTIMLVGVALFMVIAQILNSDAISAYTVKKLVPRLAIAVVLIQLSWFICTTMIAVFNVIGAGVQDLLYAPFGGAEAVNNITAILRDFYKSNGAGPQVTGSLISAAAVAGVLGGIGGAFGLLAAAIGIVVSVLIAVCVLIIRKVVLVTLIVFAPLAFVFWILPNTQKWWKMWWETFTKLLFMYPIIIALITVGHIFAYLTAQITASGIATSTVNFFVILVAYFGPLFLIPSTFKMAGGLFGKLSGVVSGAGGKLKGAGPMKQINTAAENRKKANEYNRKARGLEWSQGSGKIARIPVDKIPGGRKFGQFMAGTLGGKGLAAYQMRESEQNTAVSNAELELRGKMKEEGIYDYGDQQKYYALAAAGGGSFFSKSLNKQVEVKEPTDMAMQSATTKIADLQMGDELRRAKEEQYRRGKQAVWSGAMSTHAGKVLAVASDAVGKNYDEINAETIATQGKDSLRNMASFYDELRSRADLARQAGDIQSADKYNFRADGIQERVQVALQNPGTQRLITPDKMPYIEYIQQNGAAGGRQRDENTGVVNKEKMLDGTEVIVQPQIPDFAGRTDANPAYDPQGRQHMPTKEADLVNGRTGLESP